MNHRIAILIALALLPFASRAADVGVSIEFSQPGVFGRIDIGHLPEPVLIAPHPIVVIPIRAVVPPEPVYMYVPPEHRENWERHCQEYRACGHPVYFVDHDWYRKNVMERRHDNGRHRGEEKRGYERERDRDRERDSDRRENRDEERGRGREHERD